MAVPWVLTHGLADSSGCAEAPPAPAGPTSTPAHRAMLLDQEGHIPARVRAWSEALGVLSGSPGSGQDACSEYWLEATAVPLMVKNLFSSSKVEDRRLPATAAPRLHGLIES